MLIDIINKGFYEESINKQPNISNLLKRIQEAQEQKNITAKKNIKDLLQRITLEEIIKKINDSTTKSLKNFDDIYNDSTIEKISELIELTEQEKQILSQCYDIKNVYNKQSEKLSEDISETLNSDSELKNAVLKELENFISKPTSWLPQQFIPAIARVYKTIIFFNGHENLEYKSVNKEKEEEPVRINFIPGIHYERVMPKDWDPLTPAIVSPTGEEDYTKLSKNIIKKYNNLYTTSNISIKEHAAANNIEFIQDNDDKTVLGTLTPNGIEFPLIPTISKAKEEAIEPNESKLLDEQHKLFISFLYSVKEDPTNAGKILTFEAKNFPPNSLQVALEDIITNHPQLLTSIKFKLPPLDKCFYISPIQENGASAIQYTQAKHNEINNLIETIFPQKSHKSPHP